MILRRKIQILSAFLLNSSFFFELKSVCVPVLNCHSCPLAIFACPIGVLGQFSALHIFPLLIVGMILGLGALIGRLFCGWCCPFGLLQELIYRSPSHKIHIPSQAKILKYLILILLVFAIPFLFGIDTFFYFCKLCPPATLQSAIPWAIMRGGIPDKAGFILRIAVLGGVVLLAVAHERAFCKVLCPLGALMGICNKFSILFVKRDDSNCNHCKQCKIACPTGASESIVEGGAPSECILCLRCADNCPASIRLGKK
jgi:polyferredoxin